MSGVEIAGLALGAFPLLISAIEHYKDGAEPLADWWQFKRVYTKTLQELKLYNLLLERTLEQLILPLVADDDKIKDLLASPGGDLWSDKVLDKQLRERLSKAYELYIDFMKDLVEALEKLKHELGADNLQFQKEVHIRQTIQTGGTSRTVIFSRSVFEYQAQRIRFSFSRSGRGKLFTKIKECLEKLNTLLKTSDTSAKIRKTTERSVFDSKINSLWRHANRIYDFILKTWTCPCQQHHCANLLLQHRTSPDVSFSIVFLYGSVSSATKPWRQRETTIKWEDVLIPTNSSLGSRQPAKPAPTCSKTPSTNINTTKPISKPNSRAGLKSGVAPPSSSSSTCTITSNPIPKRGVTWAATVPPSNPPKGHPAAITNLCQTLAKPTSLITECFGVFEDSNERYRVFPALQLNDHGSCVSLGDLLSQGSTTTLTWAQRYFIGLTIASSHLQLQSTSWLSTAWSKDGIIFLRSITNPDEILTKEPYLSHAFSKPLNRNTQMTKMHPFASLGVLILELHYGSTLEENPVRQKYLMPDGSPNPFMDFTAAIEWSHTLEEEVGAEYKEAVDWCLRKGQVKPDDDSWKKEFAQTVIQALETYAKSLGAVIM
ncbi:hypothetical protein K402DRAFT_416007 [Aulographum hederae CBS 113979]|uniref:DUF7580 domain-containing protein n=1 Tax=Aulographum hederae CBS 113979 TaxID=1176131 RepID=A0A6G1HGM9_9PEZI|nr:hypothetical protein K402DRAFT_416007 [Aulographum hederae CBS 113979]